MSPATIKRRVPTKGFQFIVKRDRSGRTVKRLAGTSSIRAETNLHKAIRRHYLAQLDTNMMRRNVIIANKNANLPLFRGRIPRKEMLDAQQMLPFFNEMLKDAAHKESRAERARRRKREIFLVHEEN
ncbi:Uncharacterised protein [uncultured archaeon]|nr:Uncharacterised protein [uncultured archaeon]